MLLRISGPSLFQRLLFISIAALTADRDCVVAPVGRQRYFTGKKSGPATSVTFPRKISMKYPIQSARDTEGAPVKIY